MTWEETKNSSHYYGRAIRLSHPLPHNATEKDANKSDTKIERELIIKKGKDDCGGGKDVGKN